MDVAQVVTRGVLAQRVEGEVALRQGVGRHTLEVAEQPGAEGLERHHRRAHHDLGDAGPLDVEGAEPERVAAPGDHRTDRDDAAPVGADGEVVVVGGTLGERGYGVPVQHRAYRDLQHGGQQAPRGEVGDGDARRDRVAGHHPLGLEAQVDADRRTAEQERQGEPDQQQAGRGEHRHLAPLGQGRDDGQEQAETQDDPPDRVDHPEHGSRAAGDHRRLTPPGRSAGRRSRAAGRSRPRRSRR